MRRVYHSNRFELVDHAFLVQAIVQFIGLIRQVVESSTMVFSSFIIRDRKKMFRPIFSPIRGEAFLIAGCSKILHTIKLLFF